MLTRVGLDSACLINFVFNIVLGLQHQVLGLQHTVEPCVLVMLLNFTFAP
jgi:hypothetical protein